MGDTKHLAEVNKKTTADRFKESLLADAGIDFKKAIVDEIVKPAICDILAQIRDTIFGTIQDSTDLFLFKEVRGRRSRSGRRVDRGYTGYSDIYRRDRRDGEDSLSRKYSDSKDRVVIRGRYLDETIMFDSKVAADDLIADMRELMDEQGTVSVFDLYDMLGRTADFVYKDWGWDSMSNIYTERRGRKFEVVLPRLVSLK